MRLITTFELATRHVTELHVLFRIATESAREPDERNASRTMENIKRAIMRKKPSL